MYPEACANWGPWKLMLQHLLKKPLQPFPQKSEEGPHYGQTQQHKWKDETWEQTGTALRQGAPSLPKRRDPKHFLQKAPG